MEQAWTSVFNNYFALVTLFSAGFFVTDFVTAAAASSLFGVSIGGVAALMSVIFAESLGVASIQDTLGLM